MTDVSAPHREVHTAEHNTAEHNTAEQKADEDNRAHPLRDR